MRKSTKIWLLIAGFFVIAGATMFAAVMAANDWEFLRLNTAKHETNTYEISEDFQNISIKVSTEDVLLVPAEDGKCKVVCMEAENIKHVVSVQEGTLTIREEDTRDWQDHISIFSFEAPKTTVYLPKETYDTIMIEGSTSDIFLKKVIASKTLSVKTSTGDVTLEGCDAGEIFIKASTGDVEGSLLSDKAFVAQSSTGDVDVPKTTNGGKCEIITSTGDIEMEIEGE